MKVGSGTKVLITGASSGIGAATAVTFGSRGATVGLVARRGERLAGVLSDALAAGAGAASRAWTADLGDLGLAETVALEAWDHFEGIHVLVNNAAIPKRRFVDVLTPAEVDETMRVNFTSPVRMTLAVLPRMLAAGSGCIVNIGSMGGRVGILQEAAYCASKFALTGWTESMAADLWRSGVEVRLVQPGPVDTEIWDQPGNDPAHYDGELVAPSVVAASIVAAVEGDRLETFAPDLGSIVEWKSGHLDEYVEGIAAQRKAAGASASEPEEQHRAARRSEAI